MEKTIKYTIKLKDYLIFTLSRIINIKIFLLYFLIIIAAGRKSLMKNFSLPYLLAVILNSVKFSIFFVFILILIYLVYAAIIYKKEKNLHSEVTMIFTDEYLEEKTELTTFKLNYKDLKKIKLLKSLLIIYISPVRAFLIPAGSDYNIKDIYSNLKELKEKNLNSPLLREMTK